MSEAVRQYADALMLSGESAIGSYGQKALSVLRMASSRMESWSRQENRQSTLFHRKLGTSLPDRIAEQICNCAAEMGKIPFSFSILMFFHVCFIMLDVPYMLLASIRYSTMVYLCF